MIFIYISIFYLLFLFASYLFITSKKNSLKIFAFYFIYSNVLYDLMISASYLIKKTCIHLDTGHAQFSLVLTYFSWLILSVIIIIFKVIKNI